MCVNVSFTISFVELHFNEYCHLYSDVQYFDNVILIMMCILNFCYIEWTSNFWSSLHRWFANWLLNRKWGDLTALNSIMLGWPLTARASYDTIWADQKIFLNLMIWMNLVFNICYMSVLYSYCTLAPRKFYK